jgi:hypothetical protein
MTDGDASARDARLQIEAAHRQLLRAERALSSEYPDVAALAADLVEETEALAEVLDATDGSDDRWTDVPTEAAQR